MDYSEIDDSFSTVSSTSNSDANIAMLVVQTRSSPTLVMERLRAFAKDA